MQTPGRLFFSLIVVIVVGFALVNNSAAQSSSGPTFKVVPPPNAGQKGDSFNFQDAPVNTVLDAYEKVSGKHLVRDGNLRGLPPVSIDCADLGKDDSLKLITATLLLNNVALIPVDDQTLKVVTIGVNKNPRSEGVKLYTNAADLPADDEIVSYYMPLDHISSQEAAGIFTQVAPVHVYGGYVPAVSANGIVLTENASVIRQLIELKKQVDVVRDVVPRPPPSPNGGSLPGHTGPPHGHHPLLGLLLLLVIFFAGYFVARFRYRKRPV